MKWLGLFVLLLLAFAIGYSCGRQAGIEIANRIEQGATR
jgi:hypothetical protein